jgi:hypothetical protein
LANTQLLVPGHTIVDIALSGKYQQFFWNG